MGASSRDRGCLAMLASCVREWDFCSILSLPPPRWFCKGNRGAVLHPPVAVPPLGETRGHSDFIFGKIRYPYKDTTFYPLFWPAQTASVERGALSCLWVVGALPGVQTRFARAYRRLQTRLQGRLRFAHLGSHRACSYNLPEEYKPSLTWEKSTKRR